MARNTTFKGTPPTKRYFVAADGSNLSVLNLTDPALPGTVRRGLRDVASNHPEYFAAQKGVFVDQNVRVGPDGVFVAARKVADLGQIVERIARTDVAEVGSPVRTRGSTGWAVSGAAAGFGLGFLAFCPGDCGAGSPLRFVAPLLFPIAGGLLAALAPVRAHDANGAWRTTGQGEHLRKRLQAGSWRQIDGWLWHQ